jgi:pyruvate/2-oxoglutarate dehydrogenase complex dihydrolipoamide acyltransferase (E2) component
MVFRVVQRGEVVPVGLDLGAVGDVEADGAEDFLDAPPAAADRVQAAAAAAAAGQRDVERLPGEAGFEFPQFQLFPAGIERRLDLLLGGIDPLPGGLLFFRRKGTQLLQ